MNTLKLEEVIKFTKKFFMSLKLKRFLILLGLSLIVLYFIEGYDTVKIFPIVLITIGLIRYFVVPDLLHRETNEFIEDYYNSLDEKHRDDKESLLYICNIRKWDGPMFGVLKVSEKHIEFIPFKKNLINEKINIDIKNEKINNISIISNKWAIVDSLFFKELSDVLRISYNKSKVLIQLPNLELSSKLIKEKLDYKE